MGVVYRAKDPIIGRTVAIKAINRSFLASMEVAADEFLERFRREAQVAGGMTHPNVVKVYDLGDDYIVMEFIEGDSLSALIKGGGLPQARALEIIAEVASALDYAHAQGIVHRDIKPANIMIQSDGLVKVMDFGLARVESSDLTAAGAVLGSASYMAPEIILGKRADPRSDIFSLGVVAYEALSGKRPFAGKSVSVIMMSIVREAPVPAREMNLPDAFDSVFAKVLAKQPDDRFQSAVELATALQAAASGTPVGVGEADSPSATAPGEASMTVVRADELVSEPDEAGEETMLVAEPGEAGAAVPDPGEATTLMADAEEVPPAPEADGDEATVLMADAPAVGEPDEDVDPLADLVEHVPEPVSIEPAAVSPEAKGRGPGLSLGLVLGGVALILAVCLVIAVAWWGLRRGAGPDSGEDAPSGTEGSAPAAASAAASGAEAEAEVKPGDLVELTPDVEPPKKLSGDPPALPNGGRGLDLPAVALLEFIVDEQGRVVEPSVLESAGKVLDGASLEAIRSWTYEPASTQGVKVKVRQRARFRFEVQ
jgi:serine/threonine-protein kinase